MELEPGEVQVSLLGADGQTGSVAEWLSGSVGMIFTAPSFGSVDGYELVTDAGSDRVHGYSGVIHAWKQGGTGPSRARADGVAPTGVSNPAPREGSNTGEGL